MVGLRCGPSARPGLTSERVWRIMKLRNKLLWLVQAAVAMLGWSGCGGGYPTTP
jgi:hypothetical protein